MSILEVVELSPIFPLSRPSGWERVPDRAGEGSLSVKSNVLEMLFSVKERALTRPSATLSHCFATGEGENCRGPADCSNFSPDSPAQAGKGENDRMAVRCGKLSTPHRPC